MSRNELERVTQHIRYTGYSRSRDKLSDKSQLYEIQVGGALRLKKTEIQTAHHLVTVVKNIPLVMEVEIKVPTGWLEKSKIHYHLDFGLPVAHQGGWRKVKNGVSEIKWATQPEMLN